LQVHGRGAGQNKAARHMFAALVEIQAALPFPLLGIDSDNGSEFINEHLLRWCVSQQITFTRSRPGNKNDGCHVEQKNWDIARRTVGYWRYDSPSEVALLNRIWAALSPLINLFTPQQKLISKSRSGAKVTKRYDTAQTPYQRLLAHPKALDDIDARRLAAQLQATNPAAVRREVGQLCATLLQRVRHKTVTARAQPPTSTDPEPRSTRRQSSGHLQMSQRIPRNGQVDMSQQGRDKSGGPCQMTIVTLVILMVRPRGISAVGRGCPA
jgi:hypothetical protein